MHKRVVRSYVLRSGRVSRLQKRALETFSGYLIPCEEKHLDFKALFNKNPHQEQKLVLELGFGMGYATVALAEENPDIDYVGVEVHKPGVGKVLHAIHTRGLKNLKIIHDDAVAVIEHMIPQKILDGIHIFFPDPWPKKKHHKRRLIQQGFVKKLLPLLKRGAYLYVVTDWENYAEQIMTVLTHTPGLRNGYHWFADPQPWRPRTRFQEKGEHKQHLIREIFFIKA